MVALILMVCLIATLIAFVLHRLTFWSRQNVPNELASLYNRFQKPFHVADHESARRFGDVVGIYEGLTPCLMIKDLDLVKKVLVEDFWNFPNHRRFYVDGQLASKSLVSLEDYKWKRMRQILSPVFSPAKLKSMKESCHQCVETLISNLSELTVNREQAAVVDVRKYFGSFAVDLICSVVFGIEINSLKDPDNEIVQQIQRFFGDSLSGKQLLLLSFPSLMQLFDLYLLDYEVLKFLNRLTKSILVHRREEQTSGKSHRKDFIKLLMEAKGTDDRQLNEEEIADQIILFFVAGYDTSVASLSSVCFCLATHQSVQQQLFLEVQQFLRKTRASGDEGLMDGASELRYLDAVIKESMRFLPVVPRIERRCNKECYLRSGERSIRIPKDAMVIIPIYSLNHDERYFSQPERFDPQRFLDAEQEERLAPAYLPFAIGPRACIGQRFALMELKACLLQVVARFHFDVCPETGSQLDYFCGNPVSTTKQVVLKVRRRDASDARE